MKKSLKKTLAIILAVVMMVSSIPVASIVAAAATTNINAAITAYKTKMNGTTIYTNMTAAYKAYVDANEALDAYVYGYDTTVDLDTAATTLTTATDAMTAWTPNTTTNGVTAFSDSTGTTFDGYTDGTTNYQQNLLYVTSSVTSYYTNGTVGNLTMDLYFPSEVTFLYDGVNTPRVPAMYLYKVTSNKTRYVYAAYVTSDTTTSGDLDVASSLPASSNLRMMQYWYAVAGSSDRTANWTWTMANKTNTVNGWRITAQDTTNRIQAKTGVLSSGRKVGAMANSMEYIGQPTTALTEINERMFVWTGDSVSDEHYHTLPTIRVVNYKMLTDAIDASKLNAANYTEGGLLSYIAAVDAATAVNPASYFTSSNDYTSAANAIQSAVDTINAATITADGTGYSALRSAISLAYPTFAVGNADNANYTADSWATFETEIAEATAIMASLPTTSYNDSAAAQTAADELTAAYYALETNEVKVDTSELEIAIANGIYAVQNSGYFTADSFAASNIAAVVEAAKIALWGSVDGYQIAANLPSDSEESQALVATHIANIQAALDLLVLDYAAEVIEAGSLSIDSGITKAATYNASDYSNYSEVSEAVANAQTFKNETVKFYASVDGSVKSKIAAYCDVVSALNTAINNLKPSFSKVENGTIVNAGETNTTTIKTADSDSRWNVTVTYPNNSVIFRTKHEAATYNMGNMYINFYTSESFDQMLDAFNINDVASPSYSDSDKSELNAETDSDGYALDSTQISSVPGNFTINNAGVTFAISNLQVYSASGSIIGRNTSGSDVTDASYVWDTDLLTTQGTAPATGGVIANDGTTKIVSDYTLTMSAETAKTLSATTLPTSSTYEPTNVKMGAVFYYKYAPFLTYYGYKHMTASWSPKATVIDISYLIDLITLCDGLDANAYSTTTWNALSTALTAAKNDMAYSTMTADAILTECKTRYTNLWEAYQALEAPATNTAIKNAISATQATYDAGNTRYSEDSWEAFKSAFETANAKIDGEYSDINIRNISASDQATVDAYATALTDAYNALVKVIAYITFVDANGNDLGTTSYAIGTAAADIAVPANTETGITDDDHTLYVWPTINAVGEDDVTYTEIATTAAHTYEVTDHKDAICIEDGYNVYTCTDCGNSYTEVITAGDHIWELTTVNVAATCLEEGEGVYTCSACGETKTDVIALAEHTYTQAEAYNLDYLEPDPDSDTPVSCTQDGSALMYCDLCYDGCEATKVVEMSANEVFHTWPRKATTTVAATCTEDGYKIYTCSECGATKTEENGTAKGHTEVVTEAVAATCTATGLTEGISCSVCNEVIQAQEVVPALGHTEVVTPAIDATCTTEGATEGTSCSVCGEVITAPTVIPALGHTEEIIPAVDATCTATGLTEGKQCTVCGEITVAQTTVDALGHTEAAPVVENEVKETGLANGSYDSVVYCSVCNEELSRETITVDNLDAEAYNAALANAEAIKAEDDYADKYTADSIATFEAAVEAAKLDLASTALTQTDIDNATTAIATAITYLVEATKGFTVEFVVTNNGNETYSTTYTEMTYGQVITLSAADYVGDGVIVGWVIEGTDNATTTSIPVSTSVYEYVVTENVCVTANIASAADDSVDYTKVTLYNDAHLVIATEYVPTANIDAIDYTTASIVLNGETFNAPTKVGYTFNSWVTKSASDGVLNIQATYTFDGVEDNYCNIYGVGGVTVNGVQNYKATYDEMVALAGGAQYAITDASGNDISTYLVDGKFHAPHEVTVYVSAVDAATAATNAVTGAYIANNDGSYASIGFNNAFYVPAGATLVEWGTIATVRESIANDDSQFVIGTKGVNKLRVDVRSNQNEYTAVITAPLTAIQNNGGAMYGKSYVIYIDANGVQQTVYSDAKSVTL